MVPCKIDTCGCWFPWPDCWCWPAAKPPAAGGRRRSGLAVRQGHRAGVAAQRRRVNGSLGLGRSARLAAIRRPPAQGPGRPAARRSLPARLHRVAGGRQVRRFSRAPGVCRIRAQQFRTQRAACYAQRRTSICTYREEEIGFALAPLHEIAWVDPARIVLVGHSEGGEAAARWAEAGFQTMVLSGADCSHNGPAGPRLDAGARHHRRQRPARMARLFAGRPDRAVARGDHPGHRPCGLQIEGRPSVNRDVSAYLLRVLGVQGFKPITGKA